MRETQIDLTLQFKMPESGLNVNGVLMGLRHANARVSFALLWALFSGNRSPNVAHTLDCSRKD